MGVGIYGCRRWRSGGGLLSSDKPVVKSEGGVCMFSVHKLNYVDVLLNLIDRLHKLPVLCSQAHALRGMICAGI